MTWYCPACVNVPLYTRQILDCFLICFLRIDEDESHPCHTVGDSLDISLAPDEFKQTFYVIIILSHRFSSSLSYLFYLKHYFYKPNLFEHLEYIILV